MGIAGPRAPVPSVGPAHHTGGFALLAVCPPHPLLLLWHHQFPLLKILFDFVLHGLGAQIQPPDAWGWWNFPVSQPWKRADVHCPGLEEVAKGWDFCPPLSLGLVELHCASPGGSARCLQGDTWLLVAPVAPTRVAVTLPGPLFPLKQFPRG